MRFLINFIVHIFSNIIAFLTAAYFLDTFIVSRELEDLLLLGLVFALVNIFVKPILKFIFAPIIIITLGLFLIIINALALHITDVLSVAISILDYKTLLYATLIISIVNYIVHLFTKN